MSNGEDLKHVVQQFCPVLVFHPEEQYMPCSPEWFVEHSQLERHVTDALPTVEKSMEEATWEEVDRITGCNGVYFGDNYKLMLGDPKFRTGQADGKLCDIPMFAKLKKISVKSGQEVTEESEEHENEDEDDDNPADTEEFILEINYIFLYAYNGSYKLFFGLQEAGSHEGDWEHLTVRCTAKGELIAVYYNAHRSGDGTWVSANDCPFDDETGRLLAFVALNGHGVYPTAAVQPRIFLVANDVTSNQGRVWGCKECHILERPGKWLTRGNVELKKLPKVKDRATAFIRAYDDSELTRYTAPLEREDDPVSVEDVQVSVPGSDWLKWKVRWGTVVPCFEADWYKKAEHPTGSTPWKRTCVPWAR